jgi:Fe-S cluster assembly protein SufD
MSVDALDPSRAVAERVRALARTGPDWVGTRRRQALEQYLASALPELPRTPLRARRLDALPVWDPGTARAPSAHILGTPLDAAVVWHGGVVTIGTLPPSWREAGARVLAMDALDDSAALAAARHLGASGPPGDRFAWLNDALWSGGVLVHLPAGARPAEPLTILQAVAEDAGGAFPRLLVVAEEGAECTILELLAGIPGDAHRVLVSSVAELAVGPAAVVRHSVIQDLPPGAEAFVRRVASVARDGLVEWNTAEFGAALSVSGHRGLLQESGARMKSVTVFLGTGTQHQDYTAAVDHIGTHTASDILARGVMAGRARSVFTGESVIRKGARGSDARQKEQTLMLSDAARADAIPSLVIGDNDVFAAHSASAGPVDPSTLYYLESRGIPRAQAERLVVHGFLEPVVSQIHLPAVRDWVRRLVDGKLGWTS